jgi:DNA-binding MarR family transcriptional regulator
LSSNETGDRWRAILARALVFHDAAAARLGLNPTDLKCLEIAAGEEALTPTRLAELAGLTTGAITGVLDRLEESGFVRREPDPQDRRRLVVRAVPEGVARISALYGPLLEAASVLPTDWTDVERATLDAYLARVAAALETETSRSRAASHGGMVGNVYLAPLAGATRGRLVFSSGAPRLSLNAAALGQQVRMVAETSASRVALGGATDADELMRATFDGPPPDVRVTDGTVTMRYRRRALDLRSRAAAIELNTTIPWSFELDGGVTDLDADLRSVSVDGLSVRGGANHLRLRLPRPDGAVRIIIDGGTSAARFDRPAGCAVGLRAGGGATHVRFDDRKLASLHDGARLQSDGYLDAADRYEIELSGGASKLTVASD